MALNAEARATEQMRISLLIYMKCEPKTKGKRQERVNSNNIKAFVP